MWLELTAYPDKSKLYVNPFSINVIIDYTHYNKGAFTAFNVDGQHYKVLETAEVIKQKIEEFNRMLGAEFNQEYNNGTSPQEPTT